MFTSLCTKNVLSVKKLVSYDDPRNSPEATFTQAPNVKPVLFLEPKFACVHRRTVHFRTGFLVLFTRIHNRIGR